MTDILIIPDSHANPYHHNDRFSILGEYILDKKPEIVVNIGDMADMPSLSSYDKGHKSFEGRRYNDDVAAVLDAQDKLFAPIEVYNQQQRKNGKKQYKPRYVLTLGNHEARIDRVSELQAELDGTVSIEDLGYADYGWEVHKYGIPVIINGVAFCHNFVSGVMGRPIGGEHTAHSLLVKNHQSSVQGHSHTRDFCERTTADGRRILGLVVGCYLDEDQHEAYAAKTEHMWWRGIVHLHDVENGEFEPEFINIKQLRKRYARQ